VRANILFRKNALPFEKIIKNKSKDMQEK